MKQFQLHWIIKKLSKFLNLVPSYKGTEEHFHFAYTDMCGHTSEKLTHPSIHKATCSGISPFTTHRIRKTPLPKGEISPTKEENSPVWGENY